MIAHSRPFALFALFSTLAAQAPIPPAPALEDLLPASTYAAVRFGGLAACRAATDSMPLTAVVQGLVAGLPPELREQRLDVQLDRAGDGVRRAMQRLGLAPADVHALLSRPMALALGRLSVEGMGPSVALLVSQGDAAPAIARCVDAGLRLLVDRVPGTTRAAVDLAGTPVQQLRLPGGPPLFVASVAGHLVLTNSRGYLTEMLGVAAGRAAGLAATSRLPALAGALPAPALAAMFVNTHLLLASFAPHLPYEAAEFAAALGAGEVDALYAATTATGGAGADLLHLGIGGSERGLLKALVAAPVDWSFARACSDNVVALAAGSFDVPAVVAAFERFAALLPGGAGDELQRELGRELGRALRRLGASPQEVRALLGAFGNQVAIVLGLERGAVPKPELLVRIGVRDAAAVGSLLQRLEGVAAGGGLEWKARKVGDHVLRFCNVPLPAAELQLSPCYVLQGDALWLASDTAALVRMLRQADDAATSLAAAPDVQALMQAAGGASGVVHVRTFRAVQLGWRAVETFGYPLLDARAEQLGFGSDALPDGETLAAALGSNSWLCHVDDDGITVQGRGTFTFGALLAAFGAAGDEVLVRSGSQVF